MTSLKNIRSSLSVLSSLSLKTFISFSESFLGGGGGALGRTSKSRAEILHGTKESNTGTYQRKPKMYSHVKSMCIAEKWCMAFSL